MKAIIIIVSNTNDNHDATTTTTTTTTKHNSTTTNDNSNHKATGRPRPAAGRLAVGVSGRAVCKQFYSDVYYY